MIRVLIAEDHHVVRAAIVEHLSREPDIQVVGQVAEGGQLMVAVEWCARSRVEGRRWWQRCPLG